MNDLLLYVSIGLPIFIYIFDFMFIFLCNEKIDDTSGLDVSNEMLSSYDGIKIVLSKGFFTYYDVRRKIIKMSERVYNGNRVSDVSLSLLESGFYYCDKVGNKIINIFGKVIPTFKILYLLPIISVFINCATYNISDSKISLIILLIFTFCFYLYINIKNNIYNWIFESKIEFKDKILKFINILIKTDYMFLFSYILMMLRFLIILVNNN